MAPGGFSSSVLILDEEPLLFQPGPGIVRRGLRDGEELSWVGTRSADGRAACAARLGIRYLFETTKAVA